jgi:hypothetical protein
VPGTEPAGLVAAQATGHPSETGTRAAEQARSQSQGAVPGTEPAGLVVAQATGVRAAQQARSQIVIAFQPISGDSGGAVLYQQKLVGILWGGPCDGPRQAAYETHATCCIYIRRFLDGIGVQLKPRRPPSTTPPGTAEPFASGPTQVEPPQTVPPTLPQLPPQAADSGRLAAIEKRLEDLAAKLSPASAGPAGAPGARGPQGLPGPAGKDADPAALAAIARRVSALEKNLKGKLHFSLQVDSQTGKILSTSSGSQ